MVRGPMKGAIVSLESPPWRNDVLGFSCGNCVEPSTGGLAGARAENPNVLIRSEGD